MSSERPAQTRAFESPEKTVGLEFLSEQEQKLYPVLVPQHKADALNPDDFEDLYHEGVVRDKQYVESLEKEFRQREKENPLQASFNRRAELLEAIMAEQIELSDWFGPDALSITASRYDDIVNGVDLAIEFFWEQEFKHLALEVDVTSSPEGASKKIKKLMDSIRKGRLSGMKYFRSERADMRRELNNLPKVVIGIDKKLIGELADLRLQIHNFRNVVKDKEAYRDRLAEALSKLANHRVQDMLFDEIEIQLDAFVTHANMYSQNETTEHLRSALSLVRSVRAQKNKSSLSKDDIQQNKTDEVYRSIVNSIVDIEYDRTIT